MKTAVRKDAWGILGGMGPLASAEFVKTIYEAKSAEAEQELPVVYLLSDPTIPDRTRSLLNGREEELVERFRSGLDQLVSLGATKIVVCCLTMHPMIPYLPAVLQEKIVSLVDLIFESVRRSGRKHLLVCTEGTIRVGLFQRHALWHSVKDRILLPTREDQGKIHAMIYHIKSNKRNLEQVHLLQSILAQYDVSSYIAGCTEIHLLAKEQERVTGIDRNLFCLDPLSIIASDIAGSA